MLTGTLRNHDGDFNKDVSKTKDLTSRIIALHVLYPSLYISKSTSAKQQRENDQIMCSLENVNTEGEFLCFHIEFNKALTNPGKN